MVFSCTVLHFLHLLSASVPLHLFSASVHRLWNELVLHAAHQCSKWAFKRCIFSVLCVAVCGIQQHLNFVPHGAIGYVQLFFLFADVVILNTVFAFLQTKSRTQTDYPVARYLF